MFDYFRGLLHQSRRLSTGDAQALLERFGNGLWNADRAEINGGRLHLGGWILAPRHADRVTVSVNGRASDVIEFGGPRPDLAARLSFVAGADYAGFVASCGLLPRELAGEVPIEFDTVDRLTGAPLRPWQRQAYLPAELERAPVPDAPRIQRVHGAPDEAAFRLVGYSNVRKIEHVMLTLFRRSLRESGRVLDWGCGCGRLLRYLSLERGLVVVGADIDADNLGWCRQHLPLAEYVHLPLHPPTSLPAQDFDVLIGLSVFTHLSEMTQLEWLRELQRVSRSGAVLLMSIHGPTVHAMSGDAGLCRAVDRRGIIDAGSHDLDDVVDDRSYYRTTHHSHAYVRRVWGEYFEVVDILPACIGNVQDLVVLRRR